MTDDPLDDLERRIADLGERAQDDYDEDPVAAILRHLGDIQRDVQYEGQAFCDGFRYAKHLVTCQYIVHSGDYPCSCPNARPSPERHTDGAWYCGSCEAYLAEAWELPGGRRDDE